MSTTRDKIGKPPGSLEYVGKYPTSRSRITHLRYNAYEYHVDTQEVEDPESISLSVKSNKINWVNIDGLAPDIVSYIGDHFQLHPLLIEDLLNTEERPKVEEFEDYIFFSLKMIQPSSTPDKIIAEQLTVLLGDHYVITFQETQQDLFEPLRKRINSNKGMIRTRGADFLAYRIMDIVVDNYFFLADDMDKQISKLEKRILAEQAQDITNKIQKLKKKLLTLRRHLGPLREEVGNY